MEKTTLHLEGIREMLSREQMKLIIGEYESYGSINCKASVIIQGEVIEESGICASNSLESCKQYVVNWCNAQYDRAKILRGKCMGGCY